MVVFKIVSGLIIIFLFAILFATVIGLTKDLTRLTKECFKIADDAHLAAKEAKFASNKVRDIEEYPTSFAKDLNNLKKQIKFVKSGMCILVDIVESNMQKSKPSRKHKHHRHGNNKKKSNDTPSC